MNHRSNLPLFIITLAYFALGFINMSLAFTMLICMGLPFILTIKNRKKSWCQGLCPRADYFNLFKKMGFNLKIPRWITGKRMKTGMLIYFGVSMLIIAFSTVMVGLGKANPLLNIRFLIFFKLPFNVPQLFSLNLPAAMSHLSFRFYSLMFTSTVLGTLLALLFKPRTWCALCPVNQLNTALLKGLKKGMKRAG